MTSLFTPWREWIKNMLPDNRQACVEEHLLDGNRIILLAGAGIGREYIVIIIVQSVQS
jgi:hypothetical protein